MKIQGKAASVDATNAAQDPKELVEVTKGYQLCHIYNADETGLLYW